MALTERTLNDGSRQPGRLGPVFLFPSPYQHRIRSQTRPARSRVKYKEIMVPCSEIDFSEKK